MKCHILVYLTFYKQLNRIFPKGITQKCFQWQVLQYQTGDTLSCPECGGQRIVEFLTLPSRCQEGCFDYWSPVGLSPNPTPVVSSHISWLTDLLGVGEGVP